MARRGEHTKEELKSMAILAAERLLASDGLAGVSVRKIADVIGYAPGSFYTVFNSLDDLLLELNGRTIDELNSTLAAAIESSACNPSASVEQSQQTDSQAQLTKMAAGYIDFASKNENRWRLAFEHTLPSIDDLPASVQKKIDTTYQLVSGVLEPLVPIGRQQLAAAALWSQVHGLCILTLNNKLELGGVKSIKQAVEFAIENYLAGLRHGMARLTSSSTNK